VRQRPIAILAASLLACSPSSTRTTAPWTLSLPSGEHIAVDTVRAEHYADGDALHLFYETDRDIRDTVALRARARVLWPAFAPFAITGGYDIGAITAVRPQFRVGGAMLGIRRTLKWGVVARRDTSGIWRLDGDTAALAPPVTQPRPIVGTNGDTLRVTPHRRS
jgi:hypothetical protein